MMLLELIVHVRHTANIITWIVCMDWWIVFSYFGVFRMKRNRNANQVDNF